MTIAEQPAGLQQRRDAVAGVGRRSATTNVFVALVVAVAVYILGSAVFEPHLGPGAPSDRGAAEASFLGP